jgi:chromosome partitioning protein
MLGRRKGRNKGGSDARSGDTEAAGSTTPQSSVQPNATADAPLHPGIEDTIIDVATAHAELDEVLPPEPAADVHHETVALSPSVTVESDDFIGDAHQRVPAPPFDQAELDPIRESSTDAVLPMPEPIVENTGATVTLEGFQSEEVDAEHVEPEGTPDPHGAAEVTSTSDGPPPQSASGNPLPRVLAVANQKGGVGKTTTSVNLGAALAELGFRVLVIDLDPQGNATTGLGIDARNFELSMYDVLMRDSSLEDCVEPTSMKNLFVAPATIALAGAEIELVPAFSRELKLKRSIESIIDDFDYVLIDCPPSLGLITVNALAAADEVLVPIQCEYYALEGLSQLMRNVHLVASNLNPKLDISTIVLTMYDARTKLSDQVANEVRLHFGSRVCRNVIPRTVRLSEAPSFGQPITAFDPASRGAIAYRELAKEVSGGAS